MKFLEVVILIIVLGGTILLGLISYLFSKVLDFIESKQDWTKEN